MKRTEIRIPDEVYEKLREKSFREKKSLNELMVEAIKKDLNKEPSS